MPADLQKARALFLHAVGKLPPEQWEAYVADSCGGDADLERQVGHLLQVHREAGSFLDEPAVDPQAIGAFADAPDDKMPTVGPREGPGTVIGPYKLLQQIGEGGMGVVWMAEQTHPVQRMVAVKVIKPGMDSRQVIARFEAERQALALMDHVNIARVLDAGATEAGLPYFVMELVHGVPITKYCDDHRLTPRERLELFVPVCQAIQHAHQKGIIHRDLKPSNVMVTLYDGRPVPKVIDFGVAKALSQKLTERTLFTQYGTLVGTLEYMSPEQAEMSALGVDTRSDIFSLGVLLYELLTGSTPLNRQRFKEAAYAEILRLIKEEEPPKPSTRLTESKDSLASISAQRQTEPAKLTRLVRGELDWIVMKSLEKDRNRRYETANGFATDVQRYLTDETVQACPPSAWYRYRKFARRNKAALMTIGVVAAALLLGTAASTWQAARAMQAERDATSQRDAAIAAEQAAKESEADMAAFGKFLVDDVLAVARPKGQVGGLGIAVTIRQALDAAVPKIAETFARRPRAEARARGALGMTYVYVGDGAAAIGQLERAVELYRQQFGPNHVVTLNTTINLAMAYLLAEQLGKAMLLLEETLKRQRDTFGSDDVYTLPTMSTLAMTYRDMGRLKDAVQLLEETLKLEKAKLGGDHVNTLSTMNTLAGAYKFAGRIDESLSLYEDALRLQKAKLGPDHPHTLAFMGNLAGAYLSAGRPNEAVLVYEECLKLMKTNLGLDHPYTLGAMSNLAVAYRNTGRLQDSLLLLEEALKLQKVKLGIDHSYTVNTMSNLAGAYQDAGRLEEAVSLFEETLKLQKAKLDPNHPSTLATMSDLAEVYRVAGRLNEALPLFEETVKLQKAKLGVDHPQTFSTMSRLAATYDAAGKTNQALLLLEEMFQLQKAKLGAEHSETLGTMSELGLLLLKGSKFTDAERLLRECLAIRQMKEPDAWTTFNTKSRLGGCLLGQKMYADAEPLLLAGYEGMQQRAATIPAGEKKSQTDALERLVQLYDAWGKPDKAAEWRAKKK